MKTNLKNHLLKYIYIKNQITKLLFYHSLYITEKSNHIQEIYTSAIKNENRL